ncbi:DUF559 domain-containing protein [Bacillus sp. JJ1521]|uniref:DUF559 domain-containing protein n=1 Tax=Bacillus sp. JJ1521 TaxID=3122957 RepID=UPI002FFD89CD
MEGHFPQGNSPILKDYDDFLQKMEEGVSDFGLAGDLMKVGEEDSSFTSDNLEAAEKNAGTAPKNEKEKFFVLETDASQEEIINSMEHTDGMVVHGPPGTGKSQVILVIECDGSMYHSSPSAKERDVYRQKFLESKGWTIHRIWSRNWWKEPSAELEKVDQLIRQILEKEKNFVKVKQMT